MRSPGLRPAFTSPRATALQLASSSRKLTGRGRLGVAQVDDRRPVGARVLGEQQSEIAGIAARLRAGNSHLARARVKIIDDSW